MKRRDIETELATMIRTGAGQDRWAGAATCLRDEYLEPLIVLDRDPTPDEIQSVADLIDADAVPAENEEPSDAR